MSKVYEINGKVVSLEGQALEAIQSEYTLPPATASTLGGIKVGEGLNVTVDGTLSSSGSLPTPAEAGDAMIYDGTAWTQQGDYGYRTSVAAENVITDKPLTFSNVYNMWLAMEETPELTDIEVGDNYNIIWNGTTYNCTVKYFDEYEVTYIGNIEGLLEGDPTAGSGEPFVYSPSFEGLKDVWCYLQQPSSNDDPTITISVVIPEHYEYSTIDSGYIYPKTGTSGTAMVYNGTEWENQTGYAYTYEKPTNFVDDTFEFTPTGQEEFPFPVCVEETEDLAQFMDDNYTTITDKVFTVNWKGTEYQCQGQFIQNYTEPRLELIGFGNFASYGGSGNNEPFAYAAYYYSEQPEFELYDTWVDFQESTQEQVEIKCTAPVTIYSPFNPKYIKEGYQTEVNGYYAHAEGNWTEANGDYAHAEGNQAVANGDFAHAEGAFTVASGDSSHAEGWQTKAYANYSHAEGYYAYASSSYQHVQGQYNAMDSSNIYADIVGNGSSDSDRSNASALDWNGNLRLKGDVYVGCNADSTGGTKLGVPQVIEQTSPASITLQDNTEYYLTSVSDLTIFYPSERFDCWIDLVTGSYSPTITLPETSKYIGDEPDFGTNEEWEISIKNGRVVACKVED